MSRKEKEMCRNGKANGLKGNRWKRKSMEKVLVGEGS